MTDETPVFAGPYYLAALDGTCCYPIAGAYRSRLVVPDGARVVEGRNTRGYGSADTVWLVTPGMVESVGVKAPDVQVLVGYRLTELDAMSERFPASLTPEEFTERFDEDETRYMAGRLYEKMTRTDPGEVTEHPAVGLAVMPGGFDAHPEVAWASDQPWALIYTPNYQHLFPGRVTGLREAVWAALVQEYGKASSYNDPGAYDWEGRHQGQQILVNLRIPYSPPRWASRTSTTGRGRSKRSVTEKVRDDLALTVQVPIKPGTVVAGASKAEALAARDRIVREWVEFVAAHRVTPCGHCAGAGSIVERPEVSP